jgi:GDP/UDP-N,N'-diacetylbacillosamine 2-epimerase (hydrolysing)
MKNKLKICVITGTRAEYGQLIWLMKEIKTDSSLQLQLIVTGMHLSPEFGLTYKEIEKDGFKINKKIEMLLSADTPTSIVKSTGIGMIGFSDAYNDLEPDIVVILGDRYELLAASYSATLMRIPIAHFHGGEATEGAIDEPTRHSITKMSHIHFVAAQEYKKKVIQLGEDPKTVHNVGGAGVDYISRTKLLDKKTLEKKINWKITDKTFLVTFHPITLEDNSTEKQFRNFIEALEFFKNYNIIFTKPNSDTHGRILISMIDDFIKNNPKRSKAFVSLGQLRYTSLLQYVSGVIGNSSSGILEAPYFKIGTVNIGDRQRGRIRAKSVIDTKPQKQAIIKSINKLISHKFQMEIKNVISPFGNGGASKKAIKIIKKTNLKHILKKEFYNINY